MAKKSSRKSPRKAARKATRRTAKKPRAIPTGYHTATPYLIVDGAAQALDFYKKAFAAKETFRMDGPEGTIGHAEIRVGDSVIMLADENPGMGATSPKTLGGSPVMLHLYVDDVDGWFKRAVEAGASVEREPTTQFYGDRNAGVKDPFGHRWYMATHVEDVSPAEMKKRAAQARPSG